MKILLINNNPVVSRLTALSARKENIAIDEIREVTELNSDGYDIVFVDADSLTKDVNETIKEHLKVKKSVLFYTDGDDEDKSMFDITILKPFLPSEVSAVIRLVEEMEEKEEEIEEFNILDEAKESNKDELSELNKMLETKEKSVENKKEDKVEKKSEEELPLMLDALEDDLFEDKEEFVDEQKKEESTGEIVTKEESTKEEVVKDDELFELDIKDDSLLEDELFSEEPKGADDILDFEAEIEELKLDEPKEEQKEEVASIDEERLMLLKDEKEEDKSSKELTQKDKNQTQSTIETKILDENEIENIKGLLSEDINNEMTLEELMTPPMVTPDSKEEKKDKDKLSIESDVLVKALTNLSVEALRGFFAGVEININIKFPEAK